MNKRVTQLDIPNLGKDTPVAVAPDGELLLEGAADVAPTTLGELSDKATQVYKDSVFVPSKRAVLRQALGTMEQIADAQIGVSDTLPVIENPSSSTKVIPAAQSLITHQSTLKKIAPVAYEQVSWKALEADVGWLTQVTAEKERLLVRVQNFEILEAHLRQRVWQPMANLYAVGQSAIESHRSLAADLSSVKDLFSGAAQKAQETKKEVARALKKKADKDTAAATPAGPPVLVPTPPPIVK